MQVEITEQLEWRDLAMKKIFALLLVCLTAFSCVIVANAAETPTWKANTVTDISETDAKISVKATFTSKKTFTAGGFYIGTSKNNLHKNANPDSCNIKSSYITSSFLMSKYGETLQPGTTYYYHTYVVADGVTYKSPIYSFTTTKKATEAPSWKANTVTNLSETDAKISVKATFASNKTFTVGGFYIGTSKNNLHKNANPDSCNIYSSYITSSFLMSKYEEILLPGTTYYYCTYVVADGVTYKSPIYSFTTKKPSKEPIWSIQKPSDISCNEAKISGTITFPKNVTFTSIGYYLSDNKNDMGRLLRDGSFSTTNCSATALVSFDDLLAGKTYYYQFAVTAGGVTYMSDIASFSTLNFVTVTVSNIEKDNAKVNVQIINHSRVSLGTGRLYIGNSSDSFENVIEFSLNSNEELQNYELDINSNGITLLPKTTYYYKSEIEIPIPMIHGLKLLIHSLQLSSEVRCFTTLPNTTKLRFPLDTSKEWECSTYRNHGGGGKLKYAWCAVDINLKSAGNEKKCKVYPVADGTIAYYDEDNGQITVRHQTTLITTNGAVYTVWYSTYAHMENITVTEIGKPVYATKPLGTVGEKGVSQPHLHFAMYSNRNANDKNAAISPYYVYGFVDINGDPIKNILWKKDKDNVMGEVKAFEPKGE